MRLSQLTARDAAAGRTAETKENPIRIPARQHMACQNMTGLYRSMAFGGGNGGCLVHSLCPARQPEQDTEQEQEQQPEQQQERLLTNTAVPGLTLSSITPGGSESPSAAVRWAGGAPDRWLRGMIRTACHRSRVVRELVSE
jgi:hypothetical protein